MKKLARLTALLLTGALLLVLTACGAETEQQAKQRLLDEINSYRASIHLNSLEEVKQLSEAEQVWAEQFRAANTTVLLSSETGATYKKWESMTADWVSEAMAADPDSLFPPIMVNMIRAGETGGFLDKSLLTVADSFEADVKLQGQIKGALAYPIVVLCIALVIVAVMLLTIVPMFASMYSSMGAELPAITQIMVNMGKAAPVAIPIILVGVIAFAVFWKRNRNKDIIRTWWDPFTLKAPVFGKLDTNVALARFCNNFASMLSSGVPILQALDIVGSTSGNYVIDEASKRVSRLVERGYRLADSMSSEKIFPNMMVQMVAIGEDSGAIDKMLSSAGRAYDEEAQSMAKQLTSLLEPLMILFLGVVVGFMVVALYMPMFSMFDAINGQA